MDREQIERFEKFFNDTDKNIFVFIDVKEYYDKYLSWHMKNYNEEGCQYLFYYVAVNNFCMLCGDSVMCVIEFSSPKKREDAIEMSLRQSCAILSVKDPVEFMKEEVNSRMFSKYDNQNTRLSTISEPEPDGELSMGCFKDYTSLDYTIEDYEYLVCSTCCGDGCSRCNYHEPVYVKPCRRNAQGHIVCGEERKRLLNERARHKY